MTPADGSIRAGNQFISQHYVRQVHKDLLDSNKLQGYSSEELSHVIALVLLLQITASPNTCKEVSPP